MKSYQHLTGNMRAVMDNILEDVPTKPSAFDRAVDADLDTIALKCLQKDVERRYQSVADLARDLTNYLDGKPIEAKRDSRWYVARKTVRRHWVAAIFASIVLLLFAGYTVTTTVLVRENRLAKQEQARLAADAKAKFRLAHRTVQIVLEELARRFERTGGMNEARRAILKAAYASLKPLADEQPNDRDLTVDLGRTHALLGDIALKLGETEDGRFHLGKALEIRRTLVKAEPSTLEHWDDLSINLVRIGDSYKESAEYERALGFYREALEIDEALVHRDPINTHFQDNLGWSYDRLAHLAQLRVDFASADEWLSKAVEVFEGLAKAEPTNAVRLHGLSNIKLKLAIARRDRDEHWAISSLLDESIEAGERAVLAEPLNPDYRRSLSNAYQNKSGQFRSQEANDEAWEALDRAEALALELRKEDPDDLRSVIPLYNAWRQKAELAEIRDDWELAKDYWSKVLDLTALGVSKGGLNVDLLRKRYAALRDYAIHLLRRGERESAYEPLFAEALELARRAASPAVTSYEIVIEYSKLLRMAHPTGLRDLAASVREADRAVALSRGVLPGVLANLAEALAVDGQLDRAREVQHRALSLLPDGDSPMRTQLLEAVPE